MSTRASKISPNYGKQTNKQSKTQSNTEKKGDKFGKLEMRVQELEREKERKHLQGKIICEHPQQYRWEEFVSQKTPRRHVVTWDVLDDREYS